MADEVQERKLYATFEKYDELVAVQKSLLDLDLFEEPNYELDSRETFLLQKFTAVLAEYQEQVYLLDPFLENLVGPVIDKIKVIAHEFHGSGEKEVSAKRVERLSMLLYGYIKFRGYKTITRFFPHEVDDLPIALNFMLLQGGIAQDPAQWALRYSMMLWLSLIAMIPFDLAQFDDEAKLGHTARSLEMVGKMYLGKAGLERESAALLLSRLYIRKDMKSALLEFVRVFKAQIGSPTLDVITAIGCLQVLNEVVRNGSVDRVQGLESDYLEIIEAVNSVPSLIDNTLFCKMRTKLASGIALRMLPSPKLRRKGRALGASTQPVEAEEATDDRDVPEIVEALLQQLFDTLQNKDTVVRWSAAKGVARIAERLPPDFASQVLDTVMDMFSIHSAAAARIYDLPGIAEGTWHGATLACAEMARRNLVGPSQFPTLIGWVSKALYFDLRKGSHSIGSGVRDAAAYVLWSLARTQNTAALVPHAEDLARRLTTVALFDREIHIRRAASAAFQEHVGRTSLFPHGIDVLRKTDFYAVSGRRNAFLVAAPQVAEHPEYRANLIDHLLNVVLRHWDPAMRELGSQSLRIICELDLLELGPGATRKAVELLSSFDVSDIQGGLLVLSEMSLAYHLRVVDLRLQENLLREIFSHLASLNQDILFGPRNSMVITAACQLIGNSITSTDIELKEKSSVPNWRRIIHDGLRHRNQTVQEAAAVAYARISEKEDVSDDIKRLIKDLKSALPTIQQNLPYVLGLVDYNKCRDCLHAALDYLLTCAKISSRAAVEVRRNCHQALPKILHGLFLPMLSDNLSPTAAQEIFDTLLSGLNDYSIDERGDVGSWVRVACVKGLTSYIEDIFSLAGTVGNLDEYLSIGRYHEAVAGILKQGVERLDNVRQEAGSCFLRLLGLRPVESPEGTLCLPGFHILEELFTTDDVQRHHSSSPSLRAEDEVVDWSDGSWLFPRAVQLLNIPEYRPSVLRGLILSLGSKTDSIQRPASTSIAAYAKSLPISDDTKYSLNSLVMDIIQLAISNVTSNAVVIPVLQTFTVLLEADALRSLGDDPRGVDSLSTLLDLSTRSVGRLKSVQRIHESMKITTNLTTFEAISSKAILRLDNFLVHPFPRARADAAEYLYLLLQSSDTIEMDEAAEEILLETEWSSEDTSTIKAASSRLLALLSSTVV